MLFNSIDFAIFLPVVFLIYWSLSKAPLRYQNVFLVLASYFFYGWWDWRFLILMVFSSTVDFIVGNQLSKTEKPKYRKQLLAVSVIVNIGLLGFFKYFNFFADSFTDAFTLMGGSFSVKRMSIILPVGISFYTFQTMSYTIDVYRKKLPATRNTVAFFAFISFFPQLVAGPIERATNLLPQFFVKRKFNYNEASEGIRQILWGLFKKMVIADNCAFFVNLIFENYTDYSGGTLLLGTVLFTIQIYGDFSGYSDIAIGTARLFGFKLSTNFAYPFFSRDIGEYWRRWHISLSSWFRDYVYIPLGGSKRSTAKTVRNIIIIFVVSGFWHGANWTFVLWGFLNALFIIPYFLLKINRNNLDIVAKGKLVPNLREISEITFTFLLTALLFVVFRAPTIADAFAYLKIIFSSSLFTIMPLEHQNSLYILLGFIILLFTAEWINREHRFTLANLNRRIPKTVRYGIYYGLAMLIFLFAGKEQSFIYFQF